jgi:hypothetical protein
MQNPTPTICHFTSAHRPDDVRIFHKECTTLAAAGFQVYWVATNCEEEVKNGVHIINASVPVSGRFTSMWKTSKLVYKKALSLAKTKEELIQLCHYTNLQPLWARENIIKSNK